MPSQQFEVFAKHTRNHFNQEVLSMLDDYRRQGYEVLLATYAPGEYVPYIARELGITHYVCTPTLEEFREMYPRDPIDYRECFGLEKLLAIKEWLKAHNAEAKVLITDARFDYIIMRSVQGVEFKLVNTDPASVRRLKKAGIPFTIVQ
jgi:phosphoserine phosphatase